MLTIVVGAYENRTKPIIYRTSRMDFYRQIRSRVWIYERCYGDSVPIVNRTWQKDCLLNDGGLFQII